MQTVLAIDDSRFIHQILAARLKYEGIVIHHALDAKDGLEKSRTLSPDLILLDLDLQEVSGFDLCKELKEDPRTRAIPVIFLTATSETAVMVQGFDLGAVDYVTKPFEPAELRARVRGALRTKRYQDMLAMRAHIDALTGLWNRHYFSQRLSDELAAARRYGRHVSLALLDLDHFKHINDTYGHPVGDRVLQRLGELLVDSGRATDAACRYGGEEFAIIMTETSIDGALIGARRLSELISRIRLPAGDASVSVTASVGVASSELLETASTRELVEAADAALYAAKRSGRNRVVRASRRHASEREPPAGPRREARPGSAAVATAPKPATPCRCGDAPEDPWWASVS